MLESPTACKGQSQISYPCGEGWGSSSAVVVNSIQGQFFQYQLIISFGFQNTWFFLMVFVVTQAMKINTDPSCSKTIDPDMALSRSVGTDITIARLQSTLPRSV